MHYQLSISNAAEHFIQLKWTITNLHQPTICLQLPAWRPGRYELANYAKNIRCLQITNENGVIVPF
ncbi:MAG: M61 family peptidase, partial [Bacteroidota bacterium]